MLRRGPRSSIDSLARRGLPVVAALAMTNALAAAFAVGVGACETASPDDAADAAAETSTSIDGGRDAEPVVRPDARATGGSCTAVKGACDLVLQDCPPDGKGQAQECVVGGSGNTFETVCTPVQASQQLPLGRSCCPGAENACLPGLTCVGRPCVDGGAPTGRCSPACCQGQDQACGQSAPEGIAGKCDLTLYDTTTSTELHRVCSYRERCKLFGQEPCRAGQMCLVEDELGSASCISTFDKKAGERCDFSNDCGDGLYCLDLVSTDGGVCRVMCLTPGAVHPFDASVETAGPYRGGCPAGSACSVGPFDGLPPWLSFCRIDGG